ncbi:MAG: hypothetical protein QXG00_04960 [Candidatus Woesearchaeota archaeon]
MKKAQISVEYLLVLGLTLALLIGVSYIFFQYSKVSSEKILKSEVNAIGNKIKTTAELVYSLGEGSMIKLEIKFPNELVSIDIIGRSEIMITTEFSNGRSESVFFSDIPINGTMGIPPTISIGQVHEGLNVISVKSKGNWVEISAIT